MVEFRYLFRCAIWLGDREKRLLSMVLARAVALVVLVHVPTLAVWVEDGVHGIVRAGRGGSAAHRLGDDAACSTFHPIADRLLLEGVAILSCSSVDLEHGHGRPEKARR